MTSKQKIFRALEIVLLALVAMAIILIYISISDRVADILRLEESGYFEEAKSYLRGNRAISIPFLFVLQALTMMLAFVPPELLLVPIGAVLPTYIAIPLMLVASLAGASLVFLLVRQLHWRSVMLEKRVHRVEKAEGRMNHKNATMAAMCLWLVMPLIPFGAVAYYGANKPISYRRYILTCTIGMLPTIFCSNLLGSYIYHFLGEFSSRITGILIFLLIACILAVLCLIVGGWIKHEFYDVHAMERPNPFLYHLVVPFVTLFASLYVRISRKNCETPPKGRPVLILGSHTCFFDFYFAAKAMYPRRLTFVVNRFYFEARIVRWLMAHLGCIPKRLFSPDLETAKKLMAAKREGCSVVLFPEGRLSAAGTSFPMVGDTVSLVRHMGMDVYEYHTVGGYFCKPKWGIGLRKTPVDIHLHKIISAEELAVMSDEVLHAKIEAAISYDECRRYISLKKPDRRANVEGLERFLFRCSLCGAEFEGETKKNRLHCTACGHEHIFDKNYLSDGKTISDLHAEQMKYLKNLKDYHFEEKVSLYCFDQRRGVMTERGSGVCRFDETGIVYEGTKDGSEVRYEKTPEELQALIYTEEKHFQFYVGKELHFFYPENRNVCAKWSMLWDILREKSDRNIKLYSDFEKLEQELAKIEKNESLVN